MVFRIGECVLYDEDGMRDLVQYTMDKKHISAHRISEATGISDTTISTWLRGKHTIKYDRLQLIFAYLDEGAFE